MYIYLLKSNKVLLKKGKKNSNKTSKPRLNQSGKNLWWYKLRNIVDFRVMVHLHTVVQFVPEDLPYQIRLHINLLYRLVSEHSHHQRFQGEDGRNHLLHIEMKLMCCLHYVPSWAVVRYRFKSESRKCIIISQNIRQLGIFTVFINASLYIV